jgi:hypothetical protein
MYEQRGAPIFFTPRQQQDVIQNTTAASGYRNVKSAAWLYAASCCTASLSKVLPQTLGAKQLVYETQKIKNKNKANRVPPMADAAGVGYVIGYL